MNTIGSEGRGSQKLRLTIRALTSEASVNTWITFLSILVLGIPAVSQNQLATPAPPLKSPSYELGLGYDYLAMQNPSSQGIALNGLNLSGVTEFNSKWGASVDFSYVRKSDVLGTGRDGYVLSFLAGPELRLKQFRSAWTFAHVLVGTGVVDSVVPTNDGFLHGWVSRPSFGIGGGMEKSFHGPFAVRVDADYVRTSFANSLAAVEPQNNFRSVVSFVFRLPFKRAP
jgi:hypothetical protein